MTHDELEKLFRHGDTTPDAISTRLIAARVSTGLRQNEIATAVGIPKQTYHSQESRGAPSIKAGRYFYRAHGIDFNYLFFGDFLQLAPDVRDRLTEALTAASK
ncbi:helix-turn-helix transcriptional regulator [Pseudosulfitobacter pseudonitzschiae]|uniref:helix-turn-helix transcriptional regulator n=1 Tax=Pseudosulfitobacter pseudonitzschiae TaxID=1402135 RepID=UPI001AF5CAA3|nr:helix-turn-helix transcriptional regulator [Pseudosulfitobacter pseudonitzschiae]MBM1814916.1 XRE family transcriptional regulator [Pseudosulfitobacter pseudonitzschiae]MBM1831910.1 XRE family transcriptional regulator [Pseudosulfitobacter pseudonitzschiae]MBM1836775.1 XRE family transcriptional regulator [Pseudosulfitobacter pseudonitzschiae]MBM1841622.1 XRE family transcriptional regulator [Pseudosulfitobacter pseudonitzschiae]MBM1846489.1 XRE family transcriptional regulator [Pseudosulfi